MLKDLIHTLEEVFWGQGPAPVPPGAAGGMPRKPMPISRRPPPFLGYRPETPLRTGLEELARWLEKHLAVQRVG